MTLSYEMQRLEVLLSECKHTLSLNQSKGVCYDEKSFDELIDYICKYRYLKTIYRNAIVTAQSVGNILYSDKENYYTRCVHGKGYFTIRAFPCENNQIDILILKKYHNEYDYFLIHYISEKFQVPIEYINSYIQLRYFDF